VLALRIGLGLFAALRATLIYGEVGSLATEPLQLPRWVERVDAIGLPGPADQPA
jgi:hypothetical protein